MTRALPAAPQDWHNYLFFFAAFLVAVSLGRGFLAAAFFTGAFLADRAFLAAGLAGFLGAFAGTDFLATACFVDAAFFAAGLTAGVDTAAFFAAGLTSRREPPLSWSQQPLRLSSPLKPVSPP